MPFAPLVALVALLLSLAGFVWLARPSSAINLWFATFTLFVAVWMIGITGLQSGAHLDAFARVTFAGAAMIPASFLSFMRSYPTQSTWPPTALLRGTLVLASVIAVLALSTPLVVYGTTMTSAGLTRQTGPLYVVFSLYFLVTFIAAIVVFALKLWRARGIARAQLQYLGAGIILSGVAGISANLLLPLATGRSTYSWIGPYFSVILVTMVGHAIIRHRLMDLRLFISRGLAYVLAMVVASALLITSARLISPAWEAESLFVHPNLVVVTIVALVMLSSPAQRFITRLVDPYLYRGIEHSVALTGATRRLSRLMQPAEFASELRQILTEVLVPESFTLLVKSFPNDSFERLSPDAPPNIDPHALAALQSRQPNTSVFVVSHGEETEDTKRTYAALRAAGVEVLVTLGRRGQLLGIVLLGPRRSGDAYFKNDLGFNRS